MLAVALNVGVRALNVRSRRRLDAPWRHGHRRHRGLGHLPVPDRRAERRRPGGRSRAFRHLRRGRYSDAARAAPGPAGLMNRFFGPVSRGIDAPWKMYPVGLLFGLGFDTATEIALLVLPGRRSSAACRSPRCSRCRCCSPRACPARHHRRLLHELRLRLGLRAPVRKVFYNLVITGLSVFVAFFVGTVELPGSSPSRPTSAGASGGSCRTSTSTPPGSSSWACSC